MLCSVFVLSWPRTRLKEGGGRGRREGVREGLTRVGIVVGVRVQVQFILMICACACFYGD